MVVGCSNGSLEGVRQRLSQWADWNLQNLHTHHRNVLKKKKLAQTKMSWRSLLTSQYSR